MGALYRAEAIDNIGFEHIMRGDIQVVGGSFSCSPRGRSRSGARPPGCGSAGSEVSEVMARRNRGWAARLVRALPAAFVFGWAFFGTADRAIAQQGREEFRKGVDLFEQGKYEEAKKELEAA